MWSIFLPELTTLYNHNISQFLTDVSPVLTPRKINKMRKVYSRIKLKSSCLMALIFLFIIMPTHIFSEATINQVSRKTNIRKTIGSLKTTPSPKLLLSTPYASTNKTEKPNKLSTHISMVAESGITFISVFLFGCVIILSVYSWKKFADSSWGYAQKQYFLYCI